MKKILFFILISCFFLNLFNISYAKSINELNKEKNDIKDKVNQSKKDLEETKEEKSSFLKEVEKLDTQLEKTEDELKDLQNKLENTKKTLEKTEIELEEAEKTKIKQYESLKKRIRIIYEYGSETYLDILLDSKGIMDFFRRIEYVNKIMKHDQKIFERYKEIEKSVQIKLEEVKINKENLENLTKQTSEKKKQLESNIKNKQQMVSKLQSEQVALEQKIKDLEKEDREITNLINQAKIKATKSSKNKVYSVSGGRLAHPVPAFAGHPINDSYGPRIHPISKRKSFHAGLDLKATYGTDIVAAEAGTVIYSGSRGGYGKTVIIDHGNGLTTLYAHNSKLVVSQGESVKRGQVVAKAGSTGYSTGVHAHFEVRINGKHTDPEPYLK